MVAPLDTSVTTANLALDSSSLAQLRLQAKQSPDKALKAVAQQFESVFMNMMLKSMRDATPQDGMFDNEQTKLFTGMLDQQLAQNISSKGIGLADIMVRQLSRNSGSTVTGGASKSAPAGVPASRTNMLKTNAIPSPLSSEVQQNFISQMLPNALQASQSTGVPPQLMLGQAALESGWGKREIQMADGSNSFNLFGIKAGSSWTGKVAEVTTTEYQNGVAHQQVGKFRAYASYAEAFQDYANLISNNPRYASVLQQGGDAAGMAKAIQNSGYATDPNYADKLAQVMGRMNIAG